MGGENLQSELRRALEDWNIVSAEGLLSADTEQNNERVHEMSMELVAMVCEYLTTQEILYVYYEQFYLFLNLFIYISLMTIKL